MKFELVVLLALSWCVTSKDSDEDEKRPYEFGFTIDGQQHRHESKDVNGIIMGEFGFITADGVYHVTVYATDENGSFKILSMKNIKISEPLDTPGYQFPSKTPKGNAQDPPPTTTTTTTTQAPNHNAPYQFTTIPSRNVASCSSCKLPIIQPPNTSNKLAFQTPSFQNPPKPNNKYSPNKPISKIPPVNSLLIPSNPFQTPPNSNENYPNNPGQNTPTRNEYPNTPQLTNSNPNIPSNNPNLPPVIASLNPDVELIDTRFNPQPNNPFSQPSIEQQPPFTNNPGSPVVYDTREDLSEKQQEYTTKAPIYTPAAPTPPPKFKLDKDKILIPGNKSIPIVDPYPNMVNGLPAGITENDMLDLLYKFNYTIGFHGHYERGLKNGGKIGGYFVNGRDGISRVVEYIADENGYRPKVKFINLGLDSPDTPKEGTEKTFGLKGFEFVWYPV